MNVHKNAPDTSRVRNFAVQRVAAGEARTVVARRFGSVKDHPLLRGWRSPSHSQRDTSFL